MIHLYRAYDCEGGLLYIGVTADLPRRLHDHRRAGIWYDRMVRHSAKAYNDRLLAEAIERRAIRLLRPQFNVFGQHDQKERFDARLSDAGRKALKIGRGVVGQRNKRDSTINKMEAP